MTETIPVLVSVYNRPIHFKQCIESLKANDLALNTHLFVAIDAPFRDEHSPKIDEVIKYAKTISGFKEVTLFIRKKNMGKENIFSARTEIFKVYNKLIFSEDDNIFSSNFLLFMNEGLNKYEYREDIFSVNGYNYPINMPHECINDVYLWKGYSAWGVGIWKEKWNKINWEPDFAFKEIRTFLKSYIDVLKYNKIANHYIPGLIYMLETKQLHGDSYICLHQFLHNMYSIFPTVSRVRNIGHDGSGLNCANMEENTYRDQILYNGTEDYQIPLNIVPDKTCDDVLKKFFKQSNMVEFKTFSKLFLLNTGLYNTPR